MNIIPDKTPARALPCPAWCDKHYPTTPDSHTTARLVGGISLMLLQSHGREEPRLALGGALLALSEAQLLETAMKTLGHEDIAAAIAELAALAGSTS